MNSKNFNHQVDAYIDALKDMQTDRENYSSLWARFINNFSYDKAVDLDNYVANTSRGYAYQPAESVSRFWYWMNRILGFVFFVFDKFMPRFARFYERSVRRVFALFGVKKDQLYIYFDPRLTTTAIYLYNKGIPVSEYYDLISDVKSITENYNANKIFYYYAMLEKTLRLPVDTLNVIEIGTGAANFPVLFGLTRKSINYVIIDLPEMLLVAAHQIKKYVPDCNIIFTNELDGKFDIHDEGKNFFLLAPSDVDMLPENYFDFAVNMESFAEMNQTIANNYIKNFYRVLKPQGSIFW